ncbi:hypothetical protein [Mesorhizobium sp. B2-7-1]|uniref:hypothetical protein n=1 Tax=Mesorhizobium sp. B2-7-1 TaxID=2589909 RepID=UPI001FEDC424|nr:hypothetical protein [Mesorhizobium sp. B2-7-1]
MTTTIFDAGRRGRVHGARNVGDGLGEGRVLDGEIAAIVVVLHIDDDKRAARLGGGS